MGKKSRLKKLRREMGAAVDPIMWASEDGVHALGVGPAKQVWSLHGVPQPPHIAATYVMQLSIVLDGIWGTKGVATYSYLVGTHPPELPPIREVTDAPVTVQWLLQE